MKPLLSARGVSVGYDDKTVLRGVDFDLCPGEFVAFIGPNGVGKTTFLKALGSTVKVETGEILLEGKPLSSYQSARLARRIAHSEQTPHVDWGYTVQETVSLGRFAHRGWFSPMGAADHKQIDAVLERTGLSEFRERLVTELSGGELQR
ncbi:MAG: ABC transporter ATP-binding protein, partial [Treponemataceae bacterium]